MIDIKKIILDFLYIVFCRIRSFFYAVCSFLFILRISLFPRTIYDKKRTKTRLFLDISNIHFYDAGTGIQRVVKKLQEHIKQSNTEFEICEVYVHPGSGYYSHKSKKLIKVRNGDILLGVDPIFIQLNSKKRYFQILYKTGVNVWFFIYDLIPIINADTAQIRIKQYFEKWLVQTLQYTGIIAISESTLQDVKNYIKLHPDLTYNQNLRFEYALLGSDFQKRDDIQSATDKNDEISFLMVSTVEPRKKYDQAVQAFSILWDKGYDCTLHIVGRPGWNNEETISLLMNHNQLNKKLYWYNTGISDDELAALYQKCTAVVFASIAEGFGLAIMEAASYKKPLILRELPVFKEIAGDNAFYFSGLSPQDLADKLEEWIGLYKQQKYPVSDNIKFISWDDFTEKVLSIVTN